MKSTKEIINTAPSVTTSIVEAPGVSFVNRPWSQHQRFIRYIACRSPVFYLSLFVAWILISVWFHDRLFSLIDVASGFFQTVSMTYFVVFIEIAWLYGLYNIGVVVFSGILRKRMEEKLRNEPVLVAGEACPAVAVLYTTCNDFVLESAVSCLAMKYPKFKLYILDDSSDPIYLDRIDRFASLNSNKVQVIRRRNRVGFKAGNLNYALRNHVTEPFFVIADADEIMPGNFLNKLVPRMLEDPHCGFIQANHRSKTWGASKLEKDMGIGIDIHWARYQPLRNYYGFVMFLGHGALLRTECWTLVGGFPELVSEDLAYALAIREYGFYGTFAEDVVCFEEFPSSVRAFRIRHVKWTRGTCEFLAQKLLPLVKSPYISWVEKLDVLFPTMNLPLTFCFFVFMLNAGLYIPLAMGETQALTLVVAGHELAVPILRLPDQFLRLFTADFFAITLLTIMAPVLCFIADMWHKPIKLYRFLTHSTSLYAALSPLSTICVFAYMVTGKARFLVTGDQKAVTGNSSNLPFKQRARKFLGETHPDHIGVRRFEIACAFLFIATALVSFQVSFLGIAIAFLLLPLMHVYGWENPLIRVAKYLPFMLVLTGLALGGFGMFGVMPVFFGYGFHF